MSSQQNIDLYKLFQNICQTMFVSNKLKLKLLSDISENTHYDPDPSAQPIGDGTYKIKIKLNKDIPNYIPAAGKKIRIGHSGIPFLCTNCYRAHHRKNCNNAKVTWVQYVKRFIAPKLCKGYE